MPSPFPHRSLRPRYRLSPLAAALGAALLATVPRAEAAKLLSFTSLYANATVFRDNNGNGRQDAKEPHAITNAQGGFSLAKGKGAIYLQGGADLASGQPNTLLLKAPAPAPAPAPARAVSVLTAMWQALLDSGQSNGKIKKLLGLPKRASLAKFTALPATQVNSANPEGKALSIKDRQQATLTRFVEGLAGGAISAQFKGTENALPRRSRTK